MSRAGWAWAQEPAFPAYPRTVATCLDAGWKQPAAAAAAGGRPIMPTRACQCPRAVPPGGTGIYPAGKALPPAALREQAQGKVYVSFTVDTTGHLADAHLVKGVPPLLDAEAMRVVQSALPWSPGSQAGRPVRVSYTVPIGFAVGRNSLKRVMPAR